MTYETIRRPLHPQVQAFIDAADPRRPKLYELQPAAARAQAAGVAALIGPGPAVAAVRDVGIPAGDVTIPARVYGSDESQGTIVWFHGGGWVIGGLDTHDAMCRTLANAAHCTVVSVAYRLAPEHPFPAALDDAWAALLWTSAEYPSAPLVVGGDSAGGNLAAVCALRSRDRGGPALALQVLVYPVTDHDLATASYIEREGEDALLSRPPWCGFVMAWSRSLPMRSPNGHRFCFGAGHSSSDIGLPGRCCIQDAGATPVPSTCNRSCRCRPELENACSSRVVVTATDVPRMPARPAWCSAQSGGHADRRMARTIAPFSTGSTGVSMRAGSDRH
jgi:acetyl esterase/lipase